MHSARRGPPDGKRRGELSAPACRGGRGRTTARPYPTYYSSAPRYPGGSASGSGGSAGRGGSSGRRREPEDPRRHLCLVLVLRVAHSRAPWPARRRSRPSPTRTAATSLSATRGTTGRAARPVGTGCCVSTTQPCGSARGTWGPGQASAARDRPGAGLLTGRIVLVTPGADAQHPEGSGDRRQGVVDAARHRPGDPRRPRDDLRGPPRGQPHARVPLRPGHRGVVACGRRRRRSRPPRRRWRTRASDRGPPTHTDPWPTSAATRAARSSARSSSKSATQNLTPISSARGRQ